MADIKFPHSGKRFIGDKSKMIVHDFDVNNPCFIEPDNVIPFNNLGDALKKNYEKCPTCIPYNTAYSPKNFNAGKNNVQIINKKGPDTIFKIPTISKK